MKLRYLFILLIILAVTSVFIGVEDLSPLDLFDLSKQEASTLFASRLPRLISIVIAGLSMSICGLIMQQISRNKFVSPTTAGTMDWARLGILISLLLFTSASPLIKMLVAFVFALAGNFLFMKILERIKFNDTIFIPLVGLMLGNIVSSIATFIAYKYDLIQNVSSWLQGDFSLVVKGRYELLYLSIPLVIIAYVYADKFTLAGMGESFSVNLGLKYKRVVNIGLIIVSLITSLVILTVGMLPFLGLIIPNIVSIYRGDNLKSSLPHTVLLGAVFVLFCDILGRIIIFPYEISIGLMVGIIGSGIFLFMLLRRKAYA
ncbi:iron ABC transporter permease [Bacillus subtilis subsp. subtilis]|uniref:Petrobactin import system permease protein YclN n=3 Tax=Bacillus subtilis subsp. subtilis TaxID=135461 RepID=YCLN_BACSU|nr:MULTISPECIES: petrobactin ABC transporter permease YclN [Bacillales]NP_388262.1 petrobactin iron-siderophore ABC transporter (permease) [Bacillus subtilis subsp. subtilis str. 168]P94418.1 RecName: Full=Petrobactin import system permease protein YclN [Bacillus subtilis subsp. subtilis str. 168]BAM49312.1 iron-siderophore ABC transporter permease [Bacillus subtilis BEST7613]AFQ56317.1 Putative iron-siderophore ABC transporter(permease) [Bacillus subtilis QB928]AGG59726.1 putative iron-sidero